MTTRQASLATGRSLIFEIAVTTVLLRPVSLTRGDPNRFHRLKVRSHLRSAAPVDRPPAQITSTMRPAPIAPRGAGLALGVHAFQAVVVLAPALDGLDDAVAAPGEAVRLQEQPAAV